MNKRVCLPDFCGFVLAGLLGLSACQREKPLFERLDAGRTGITFANTITESDTLNVLNFEYIYNGGGVGVGDFNNDGWPDVFFSGNQVPCRLYLNRGSREPMRFDDVTPGSGIETPYWNTGVSLIDINQDGLLDIYLCTANPRRGQSSPNQLFVNQGFAKSGKPQFREMAEAVGLADRGYSTQAAWLDYDRDGDLDMYLLTNALEKYERTLPVGQKTDGTGLSTDRLYRNDSDKTGLHFTNVSREAGILTEGWGLGVGVSDVNGDGWPDVYAANDFQSNDLLWINDGHGHFRNRIADCIRHQSANSMGTDIADVNNDGRPDIVTLDMMPDDNLRQKMMFGRPGYDRYQLNRERGYQPQFVRNSLQLNNGPDSRGEVSFSEVGQLAGVSATDWSWSALLADFDNDGFRDLLVTNGYKKDVTNLDFISYQSDRVGYLRQNTTTTQAADRQESQSQMDALLGVKKSNFMYRNRGTGPSAPPTFEDVTERWGLSIPSYSNGAAYADFDNDGDLDLVINNINDETFVYRNTLHDRADNQQAPHFLRLKLAGMPGNSAGIGAKIRLYYGQQQQVAEQALQRGYKSTIDPVLHVGLGAVAQLDSLVIEWPTGKTQTLRQVPTNQTLTLTEANATLRPAPVPRRPVPLLTDVTGKNGLAFRQTESEYVDFKVQFLLPRQHAQQGPGIAVGDMNGDGLEDVFIGGPAGQPGTMALQQPNGQFRQRPFQPKAAEDTGVLLFDADNDGDNDLYCVSGSSEFGRRESLYQNRFYRNAGRGVFTPDSTALPRITASGSCVTAADFDRDGDLDLFVGGRVVPVAYPLPARSYLLQNDGHGHFTDVTARLCPALTNIGMVTAALWTDTDNDQWPDLLLVGEWMPITLFKNNRGRSFTQPANPVFTNSTGWWNSLTAGDFDNDGDMDYVAGNLGLNSFYKASATEPVCVYADDYNQDGLTDGIICHYVQGREYPVHYRDAMTDQIAGLRRTLRSYADYGRMTFRDLFPEAITQKAYIRRATQFASVYIENRGNTFVISPLPMAAQVTPIYGMQVADLNQDGNLDLLTVGNDYSPETLTGRYDAGIGSVLPGNGHGQFRAMSASRSGFFVAGDAKGFARLTRPSGESLWLVTQNQDSLKTFRAQAVQPRIPVRPDEQYADIQFGNGQHRRQEFYYGDTYLSQSSRRLDWPAGAVRAVLINSRGQKRTVSLRN